MAGITVQQRDGLPDIAAVVLTWQDPTGNRQATIHLRRDPARSGRIHIILPSVWGIDADLARVYGEALIRAASVAEHLEKGTGELPYT
ncbi:MAG: hypothetical protein JW910_18760 [Anaerolineae bacterium]|nr:hypothetical protein [Anaerolineae bacterium]